MARLRVRNKILEADASYPRRSSPAVSLVAAPWNLKSRKKISPEGKLMG